MTSSSTAFLEYATAVRPEIDAALERITHYGDQCPPTLVAAIRHSLLAPGKRLRPLLALMAAEACGCSKEKAMAAACAVEMVHTYSLIHDDLPAMDDDAMRRGQPSCHAAFGEAMAILAGDALLTQAFEVICQGTEPAGVANRCCCELAVAAGYMGMVGGQVDDLSAFAADGDVHKLEHVHDRKTGAMIRLPLRLGAIIASASEAEIAALNRFGEKLGLAFQIIDDLLDISGSADSLGKSIGKDANQGKVTFPSLLGVERSRQRAEELVHQAQQTLLPFGSRAQCMESLAAFVVERNR